MPEITIKGTISRVSNHKLSRTGSPFRSFQVKKSDSGESVWVQIYPNCEHYWKFNAEAVFLVGKRVKLSNVRESPREEGGSWYSMDHGSKVRFRGDNQRSQTNRQTSNSSVRRSVARVNRRRNQQRRSVQF